MMCFFSVFYHCVFEIQLMSIFELKVLVPILPLVSPCCGRGAASSCTRSLQDELDELRLVFLCGDEADCIGSFQAVSLVVLCRNLYFSLCFGEERGSTALPKLCRVGSLCYDRRLSSFLIHPFFVKDRVHEVVLASLRLAHSASLPVASTCFCQDQMQIPQKSCSSVFDVSSIPKGVLTLSNACAKTNPWLAHPRLHHES